LDYDRHAGAYWEGTRDRDVSQNIGALLQNIRATPPFELLDFGCGPGRDLKTFKALGHRAIGLEGSRQLAQLARTNSGCDVLEQSFLELDLPRGCFGAFANAALLHVPSHALPSDRYGAFYDWAHWHAYVSAAGFVELTQYCSFRSKRPTIIAVATRRRAGAWHEPRRCWGLEHG
jgi:SAM-dependent methyltransferase